MKYKETSENNNKQRHSRLEYLDEKYKNSKNKDIKFSLE